MALKVQIAQGRIDILTMFILLIQEHGMVFHLSVSSSISFMSVLQFLEYRSFTSLVRFIPRYLMVLGAIVNGINSLISLSVFSLLGYKKASDFCTLTYLLRFIQYNNGRLHHLMVMKYVAALCTWTLLECQWQEHEPSPLSLKTNKLMARDCYSHSKCYIAVTGVESNLSYQAEVILTVQRQKSRTVHQLKVEGQSSAHR